MKTCPYAISGLLSQSEFVASVLDGCTPVKDYSTLVACREEDCGRYALCNQETTQKKEQPPKSKVHLFQLFYSVPTRERNIIKSAISAHGIEYVELMTLKEWVQEKNCGVKTAQNIMDFLHGNKDGEA